MYKFKFAFKVFLWLTLLSVLPAGISSAQGGITLSRNPAPPQAVFNDGTHSINFTWTIDYATQFSQNYIFQILDLNGAVVKTESFAGSPSPINNSTTWLVPAAQASGPYYGKLSFFSNWQSLDISKPECQAQVGFLISPAARIQLRKFWDWVNADGIKDGVEETLEGWHFTVKRLDTGQEWYLTSGFDGNTESIMVPVKPTGTTDFTITEEVRPGWVKTGPNGSANPVTISLAPGSSYSADWGNWQPIIIEGQKLLDEAPWPLPADFPIFTTDPLPDSKPIQGIIVHLYDHNWNFLDTAVTDANGHFAFPLRQWDTTFYIVEDPVQSAPPVFNIPGATPPVCAIHEPLPWSGTFVGIASQSPWQSPNIIANPTDTITVNAPAPGVFFQSYGENYFYNRLPSRIWGAFCEEAMKLNLRALTIHKDNILWPTGPAYAEPDCGFYQVPTLVEEPEGLRPGTYVLTPPILPDPENQEWVVTTYRAVNNVLVITTTRLASGGSYSLDLLSDEDVRVDFCIQTAPNKRVCNLPVTFTQEGFKTFSDPANTTIPGGMLFSRFGIAFPKHLLIVGNTVTKKTITFDNTTGSQNRLAMFLPQTGASGKLDRAYIDPWDKTTGGTLAAETITLLLNIAYNEAAIMPRTPGWQFDKFTLNSGIFKGKTVGAVYVIASAVLGGDPPAKYGLASYQALTDVVRAINANYEFVDYNTYNDRGYLTKFGEHKKAGDGTPITVPFAP